MKLSIASFLLGVSAVLGSGASAFSSDRAAPAFPFHDWAKIQEGSTLFDGGLGSCGPQEGELPAVSYLIQREDGMWRLFAPTSESQSNRWFGVWMEPTYATPKWVYFGTTRGNTLTLDRIDAWDVDKHNDACAVIFPK